MKSKMKGVVGIALTLVLLASLTVGLSAVPAGAAPGTLKFTTLTLPKVEEWTDADDFAESEGDFWATPGTDVGPIAIAPDGKTMFAAVAPEGYTDWFHVLKSTDGGYSWIASGFYDEWDDVGEGTPIVDIVVSPEYAEDTTVVVATEYTVYQSVDGGKEFACMEDDPDWGYIRDMDVTLDEGGRLAMMIGCIDDVYVLSTETALKWKAQDVGSPVLACAFSPNFADDEGISAVVTDGSSTTMRFAFAYTKTGGGWNTDIKDAPVTNAKGDPFGSVQASIGFPDDFDAWGIGNNVCFVGIYGADPDDIGGDVYKIGLREVGTSSATDLDVRGVLTTLLPTATDIVSLNVCGNAEEATILVGTDYTHLGLTPPHRLVYYSKDAGATWSFTFKEPTGGTGTGIVFDDASARVLMAPDFLNSGIAYVATLGDYTSALSRTTDGGNSWNQISLIDYGDPTIGYWVLPFGFSASGYTAAGTLRMTTAVSFTPTFYSALWERTGGKHFERILSYANAGVSDNLFQLSVLSDAIFISDWTTGEIYRSTDNGATFPKKITTKEKLTWVQPVSATTIYTGHADGNIYWSTKSGVGWTKPDNSEISSTDAVASIGVAGDVVLASTYTGKVFISSDGGEVVEKVSLENPGKVGYPTVATFDLGFAANNMIYAISVTTAAFGFIPVKGSGVWRTTVDLDDPHAAVWDQIDNIDQPDEYTPGNVVIGSPAIALPPAGVLYVIDGALVNTTPEEPEDYAGGLWRSVNPTADIDSVHPPYFEKENKGLEGDGEAGSDCIGLLSLDLMPPTFAPTFFCYNAAAPYYEQVVLFTDTLNTGVTLASPANNATGVGLVPEGGVKPQAALVWAEKPGATSFQYQLALDSEFKSVIDKGYVTAMISLQELLPNTTYYWRVRVAGGTTEDTTTYALGAPLISPWSETWKFKSAIGPTAARPELKAPEIGQLDVPLNPTFSWTGVEWAVKYDFELATDPTTGTGGYFTKALIAKTGANALVSTAWLCDTALQYETRYYWHAKAIGVDTETPWSDVGTFTTIAKPVPPTPPVEVKIPPTPAPITPAWIWAIVVIGAILVIAVIVLIVTTRRVP